MKVYCFGNEFLENDSLAKELADEIRIEGIEFVKCKEPSDILMEEREIIILDVVEGISKVMVIEDLEQLKAHNLISLHDFDLSFFLKLMKKMNLLNRIKIIGIPMRGDKNRIKEEIITRLRAA